MCTSCVMNGFLFIIAIFAFVFQNLFRTPTTGA